MTRRKDETPHYRKTNRDVISFIGECARAPNRNTEIRSNEVPWGLAWAFRRRIYTWRHSVLETLANVETDAWKQCTQHIEGACGKRVNAEWLDLLAFKVERIPGTDNACVVAFLKPVCHGPDIRFADLDAAETAAGVEAFKQMLRAAQPPEATWEPNATGR